MTRSRSSSPCTVDLPISGLFHYLITTLCEHASKLSHWDMQVGHPASCTFLEKSGAQADLHRGGVTPLQLAMSTIYSTTPLMITLGDSHTVSIEGMKCRRLA